MRLQIDPTSPSGLSIAHDTGTQVFMSGSSTSGVQSIIAGANVTVDSTDPAHPIISASGEGGTTDHASLSHLAYADSGHTGFAPALGSDDNYVTDAEKAALHPAITVAGEDYLTLSTQSITANPIDLDNLSATGTPSSNTYLRGDNSWAEISAGSGGYAANLYFTTIDSDISGYKKISYTHEATETILTAAVSSGETLVRSYIYDSAIGTTIIDSGKWVANYYAKVDITAGTTTLNIEPFVRHTDNTETTLFKVDGIDLNSTDYVLISTDTIQPTFDVLATDRLGIRVYAEATSAATITISTKVGDGNASYFTTPLAIRHAQLRGLNDDTNNVHVTSSEKSAITHSNRTVLDNTTASFTTAQDSKLSGIATGAEVNVQADWNQTTNTADDYIKNKPTIPTQYTDEMAQDAVGGMVDTSLTYTDGTPQLKVTIPVNSAAVGFTITGGDIPKTLTVADTASVTGTNTGDQTGGTPALTLGTANTAGNATTFIRTNDTILAFDATAPSTQAFGDAAAVGTATVAARRDHKHAMPATTKDTTAVTGLLRGNGSVIAAGTVGNADLLTTAGEPGGAWKDWTPTLTNLSGGTLNYAKYTLIGKTVHFRFKYTLAGAGVAGAVSFTTPTTMSVSATTDGILNTTKFVRNASYIGEVRPTANNTLAVLVRTSAAAYVGLAVLSSTVPDTWAANDTIFISGTYEAA